ncbi:MAG: hypothetical protein ACJASC_002618 [Limimaricola cinnabarinus]|jgi:hypothetical protein
MRAVARLVEMASHLHRHAPRRAVRVELPRVAV